VTMHTSAMPELDPGRSQWFTRPELCRRVVRWAGVRPGMRVLEPGAGSGNFVAALVEAGADVTAVEIDRRWVRWIRRREDCRGAHVTVGDFLKPATVGGEDREAELWSPLRGDSSSTGATLPTNATLQAQLKALIQITQSLRKTLSLDEVLPQILDTLFVILPAADRRSHRRNEVRR